MIHLNYFVFQIMLLVLYFSYCRSHLMMMGKDSMMSPIINSINSKINLQITFNISKYMLY